MKEIKAIIRTSKFEEVKEALHDIDIDFFSYWDATGVGNEKKKSEQMYRGTHLDTSFIPRRTLEIVVRDQNVKKTIDCILKSAFTGEVGDGRIFVTPVEEAWKIRNKQSGDDSLKGADEK